MKRQGSCDRRAGARDRDAPRPRAAARSASSASRRNSPSSSRKRTPRWARVTSPGPRRRRRPRSAPGGRDRVVRRPERAAPPAAAPSSRPAGAGDPGHLERLVGRAAAAGSTAAGAPPASCPRRAGRSAAGCGRRRRRPRARGAARGCPRRSARSGAVAARPRARGRQRLRARRRPLARRRAPELRDVVERDHLEPRPPARPRAPSAAAHRDPAHAPRPAPPRPSPARRAPAGSSRRARARRRARGAPARSLRDLARRPPAAPPRSPGRSPGPALRQVGGREVDRDPLQREVEAGVDQRRPHPLARLAHRGVGQADDRERRAARGATSTSTWTGSGLDRRSARRCGPSASTRPKLGGAIARAWRAGCDEVVTLPVATAAHAGAPGRPRSGAMTVARQRPGPRAPRTWSPRRLARAGLASRRAQRPHAHRRARPDRARRRDARLRRGQGRPRRLARSGPARPAHAVGAAQAGAGSAAWPASGWPSGRCPRSGVAGYRFDVVGVSFGGDGARGCRPHPQRVLTRHPSTSASHAASSRCAEPQSIGRQPQLELRVRDRRERAAVQRARCRRARIASRCSGVE